MAQEVFSPVHDQDTPAVPVDFRPVDGDYEEWARTLPEVGTSEWTRQVARASTSERAIRALSDEMLRRTDRKRQTFLINAILDWGATHDYPRVLPRKCDAETGRPRPWGRPPIDRGRSAWERLAFDAPLQILEAVWSFVSELAFEVEPEPAAVRHPSKPKLEADAEWIRRMQASDEKLVNGEAASRTTAFTQLSYSVPSQRQMQRWEKRWRALKATADGSRDTLDT